MQQIVDLENDPAFQALNVGLVSIARDSLAELAAGRQEYGISATPLLSDSDQSVSQAYDVLRWAIASGEPGHTFILVDQQGQVAWIEDYGAPDNPNRTMYVPVDELVQKIRASLPAP
ncbi:MAG TPA: redoxin domain-containing protein [Anaerolineales bacterium]|nr:redoxin domain-containing protein [Anaerolineales bacterium]